MYPTVADVEFEGFLRPAASLLHVRVRPFDGECGGESCRLLAADFRQPAPNGRLHLGMDGITRFPRRIKRAANIPLTVATLGTSPTTGFFITDGLLFFDRKPKPAYWELKKTYQPLHVVWSPTKPLTALVENRFALTDLADYRLSWELWAEEETNRRQGSLELLARARRAHRITASRRPETTSRRQGLLGNASPDLKDRPTLG